MVVIAKIKYGKIIDMGFDSKNQALRAFKQYKSLRNETEDEYLERIYPMIKHIIHNNQINELLNTEKQCRNNIICQMNNSMNFIYDIKNKGEKYIELEDKCKLQYLEINRLESLVFDLSSQLSSDDINNSNMIMRIPIKKNRQCNDCSICNDVIQKNETILNLCHNFHIRCITIWLYKNTTCPYCRKCIECFI